jgi:hypothetical protein
MDNPTITDLLQRLLVLRQKYGDIECCLLSFESAEFRTIEKTSLDFAVVTDPDDTSKKLLTLD